MQSLPHATPLQLLLRDDGPAAAGDPARSPAPTGRAPKRRCPYRELRRHLLLAAAAILCAAAVAGFLVLV